MLKKILLALVLIGLTVSIGCKQEEPTPVPPNTPPAPTIPE